MVAADAENHLHGTLGRLWHHSYLCAALPLFMILLLTLRGLLGDAMAMGSLPNGR